MSMIIAFKNVQRQQKLLTRMADPDRVANERRSPDPRRKSFIGDGIVLPAAV
jgi:hypothetical protein